MEYLLILIVVVYTMIALLIRKQYKGAHKRYNIKHNGDIAVVRDAKGKFVTITDNWWNVAKLGV